MRAPMPVAADVRSLRLMLPLALTLVPPAAPAQATPTAPAQSARGQKEPTPEELRLADIAAFDGWLQDYKKGAMRLTKEGRTDDEAIAALDARMKALAAWNTLDAAKALFAAASVVPKLLGAGASTEDIDFNRELQPWKVQTLACNHLRTMTGPGILPWLLELLGAAGIRGAKGNQDQVNASAVLRILGGHTSPDAQLALLRACKSMPVELRVHAVNAMARDATLESASTLIDLLRDVEPNIRIAACNALGTALQPHVDESLGRQPAADVLKMRDLVIAKLEELLLRDQIWQVRSAAAFSLAILKCKAVIPVLIRGLEAELQRKKDPWAMDLRLHRLLEGLTGQSVVRGTVAPWQEFWKREGQSFRVAPKRQGDEPPPVASRYEKFFDLEVESDRVLFVLDFSGSMEEPITLQTSGTGVASSQASTTKTGLVISELKKLIMSLPDTALINVVVFSDDVRVWRQEGGRPALVRLDDDARDDLLGKFLDGLRPAGATNLYGAMAKALDFAGRALHDSHYSAGFDTLYVITDGAPSAGEVTDKEEIRRRVREMNQLRRITINCITFGAKNDTDFLKPLAEENGGRHIHVE
jgi:HEAT repeat protein